MRSGILPGMRPRRGFLTWLVVLAVVGFAGRLVWIFAATKGLSGFGDDFYYHAGAILLRKAADQAGLSAVLSAALRKKNASPLFDRGIVLVSVAVSIALGATSMSDIALLAHLAPVLGAAPSGPTVRRALELAGAPAMLDARYSSGVVPVQRRNAR